MLIVSGQNLPVDDLFRRFGPIWNELGGRKGGKHQPKAVRLYSWKSESQDFVRRFAKIGRHIQHTIDERRSVRTASMGNCHTSLTKSLPSPT